MIQGNHDDPIRLWHMHKHPFLFFFWCWIRRKDPNAEMMKGKKFYNR